MSKKLIITIGASLGVILAGYGIYHYMDYQEAVAEIKEDKKEEIDEVESQLKEIETQVEDKKEVLNYMKTKTPLYGFFYNSNLDKYVYKQYDMSNDEFNLRRILETLSYEDNSDIQNIYKKFYLVRTEINGTELSFQVDYDGWENLSSNEKYKVVIPLLWTLYSSTNFEQIFITVNGQPLYIDGYSTIDLYSRTFFNPLNDDEFMIDNEDPDLKYFPMVYEIEDGFKYLETNITSDEGEMRRILDNISKEYGLNIKHIEIETQPLSTTTMFKIELEDSSYIIDKDGEDKEFVEALSEAFKLAIPFKHSIYINEGQNPTPVALNFGYLNNQTLKK